MLTLLGWTLVFGSIFLVAALLVAWLVAERPTRSPRPVARSVGTGPVLQGGSVHHARQSDPPARVFYDLASSAAEDGNFEAAASYLIEASRRDG